jgi:rare lipoprotein A
MFKFQALPALCAAAALLLSACASTPKTAESDMPAPPKARGDDSRFEMTQNGRRMSADDFDAWMKSRGIRIAQGPGGAKPEARTAKPRSRSESRTATAPTAAAKPKPKPVAVASTVAPGPTAAKPGASAKPAVAVKPKAANGVAAAPKPTAAAATRPATSAKPKPKGSGSSTGL